MGRSHHNEKLEFLGDAVLDLVLGEYLMEMFSELNEGPLSKMRAHLVNESSLAAIATDLRLAEYLKLGKGEQQSNGKEKPRLLASCFEALVGAIFVDQGFDKAKQVVRKVFAQRIENLKGNEAFDQDYKSQLQELVQSEKRQTPIYKLVSSLGPAHERVFQVQVLIGNDEVAIGEGKSKKSAEQTAAKRALLEIKNRNRGHE